MIAYREFAVFLLIKCFLHSECLPYQGFLNVKKISVNIVKAPSSYYQINFLKNIPIHNSPPKNILKKLILLLFDPGFKIMTNIKLTQTRIKLEKQSGGRRFRTLI